MLTKMINDGQQRDSLGRVSSLGGLLNSPVQDSPRTQNSIRNDAIINALKNKGATNACSSCGGLQFEIVGESQTQVLQGTGLLASSAQSVPTIIVACSHCGNLSHYAIGILQKA